MQKFTNLKFALKILVLFSLLIAGKISRPVYHTISTSRSISTDTTNLQEPQAHWLINQVNFKSTE
jgi:hypothetical protein